MDTETDLRKQNLIVKSECPQIFLSNLWTSFHVLSRDAAEAFTAGKNQTHYCSYANKLASFLQRRISSAISSGLSRACPFHVHFVVPSVTALFSVHLPGEKVLVQIKATEKVPVPACCGHLLITSHRTSLQCFLQGWPTQLKKKPSFLIMCSLTARWDESALRVKKENVGVSGQKRLKFFAP